MALYRRENHQLLMTQTPSQTAVQTPFNRDWEFKQCLGLSKHPTTKIYKHPIPINIMQFKKKMIYSWLISSSTLLASMIFPLIPCQTSANIPNPTYSWKMCRLNPDLMSLTDLKTYFLGYTPSMFETYLIVLIAAFFISFLVFHFVTRKKTKA